MGGRKNIWEKGERPSMKNLSQAKLISSIYREVFDSEFHVADADQRVMLQKTIYLLMKMGVKCGDYYFYWDRFGPFSIDLCYDMRGNIEEDSPEAVFDGNVANSILKLKQAFKERRVYSIQRWVEAIGSLEYLHDSMYPSATDDELVKELSSRKEYLQNTEENRRAMEQVRCLCYV